MLGGLTKLAADAGAIVALQALEVYPGLEALRALEVECQRSSYVACPVKW
jgi:hypothetical protein